MKFSHFTISQQGDSHIKAGKNCQDYSGSISVTNQRLNITFGIVAIADGVGSCDYSEYGSKIAVTTVLEELKKDLSLIENGSDKAILSILKSAYTKANDEIEREAEVRELPFKLFDTTLTVTILNDSGTCYVGHIGDDGAVALMTDGTYSMITTRIEGEEANSVIPLSSTDYWTFGVVKKPVAALVLLTDGLLDKAVGSERMRNRVYYPFFKSLFENIMETEEDVNDFRNTWDGYLQEKEFRDGYGVTDDITLALIQIPDILKNVKPSPFDEGKWNEDSKKAKKEIEDALSNNSKERPAPVAENKIIPPKPTPAENAKQPAEVSSTNQQATNHAPLHSVHNSHNDYSESYQPKQRTISSSDNSSRNNFTSKSTLRVLIPVVAIALLLGVGLVSRKVGYDAGVASGKQQEQSETQEQLDRLHVAHEEELKAEYDRGYRDAEIAFANKKENEEPAQSQMTSPENYVIARGQRGEIVKTIQEKLILKGWSIKPDGIYGELTEEAIRDFQQLNSLPITGAVDILTFWALEDNNSKGSEALSNDTELSSSTAPDIPDNSTTNPDTSIEMETSEPVDTIDESTDDEEKESTDKSQISLSTGVKLHQNCTNRRETV